MAKRNYIDKIFTRFNYEQVEYQPGRFMNVCSPDGDTETKRVYGFFCHASDNVFNDDAAKQWQEEWVSRGYVWISPEYRRKGEFTPQLQEEAVKNLWTAERFTRSNYRRFGVGDGHKYFYTGESSGALTSLHAAIAAMWCADFGSVGTSVKPLASATFSGDCAPAFQQYIRKRIAGNHFFNGGEDEKFPWRNVKKTFDAMIAVGSDSSWTLFDDAGHGLQKKREEIMKILVPKFAELLK